MVWSWVLLQILIEFRQFEKSDVMKKYIIMIGIIFTSMFLGTSTIKGSTTYYIYNGKVSSDAANVSNVTGFKGAWNNNEQLAYRITFVDKNGKIISGSKKVDYYLGSELYADYYYTGSKFELSTFGDILTRFSSLKNESIKKITYTNLFKGNTDEEIVKNFKSSVLSAKSTETLDTLLKNAEINAKTAEDATKEKNLFVLVEKIYNISIMNVISYWQTGNKTVCETYNGNNGTAYVDCMKVKHHIVEMVGSTQYVGTGSEMVTVIGNYIEKAKSIDEISYPLFGANKDTPEKYKIKPSDLYFSETTNIFLTKLYLDTKPASFGFINTVTNSSISREDAVTKGGSPYYGYNLNIIEIGGSGGNSPTCTISNPYKSDKDGKYQKVDWDSINGKCCEIGETYIEGVGCEDENTAIPDNYRFTSSIHANTCNYNGKSYFETISSCKQNTPTSQNVNAANCVYKNENYATKSGSNIYCYDSVTADVSKVFNSFPSFVKSGAIIPIYESPTVKVIRQCYSSDKTTLNSYISNINVKSLGIGSITLRADVSKDIYNFSEANAYIESKSNSTSTSANTVWGETYFTSKVTATVKYNNTYLNKFISIKSYLGSGSNQSPITPSIQVSSNVNMTVPLSTPAGNYTASIEFEKTGLIEKTYGLNNAYTQTYNYGSNCTGSCTTYSNIISRITPTIKTITVTGTCTDSDVSKNGIRYIGTCGSTQCDSNGICKTTKTIKKYQLSAITTNPSTTQSECNNHVDAMHSVKFTPNNSCSTVTFSGVKDTNLTENLTCNKSLTVLNELSDCDPGKEICDDEDLLNKLIYRPIDLNNPFPGRGYTSNSNGRGTYGRLWNPILIRNIITNRQDVYTKTPLYSITLTPTDIKKIRQYNATHSYDDFTLQCTNGEACTSTFLRRDFNTIVNTELTKSACFANITANNFKSCAESRWQ